MNTILNNNHAEILTAAHGLLYFTATWCGPCTVFGPRLDRVLEGFEGQVEPAKVDVDLNQELSSEFKVMTIPTVILFKNGEERGRFTGGMNDKGISDVIDALLDEDDE